MSNPVTEAKRQAFSAEFERHGNSISVFELDYMKGKKAYLGTLTPVNDSGYEGKYVFCLDAGHIVQRHHSDVLHIPSNVLRDIADYGIEPVERPILFYVDALGVRHGDKSSGFAWLRADNKRSRVYRTDSLTSLRAHCSALLEIVNELPSGSRAVIYTSSRRFTDEFDGRADRHLRESKKMIRAIALMVQKDVRVPMRLIPREENRAADLLDVYLP